MDEIGAKPQHSSSTIAQFILYPESFNKWIQTFNMGTRNVCNGACPAPAIILASLITKQILPDRWVLCHSGILLVKFWSRRLEVTCILTAEFPALTTSHMEMCLPVQLGSSPATSYDLQHFLAMLSIWNSAAQPDWIKVWFFQPGKWCRFISKLDNSYRQPINTSYICHQFS
jgi:hypothetical protein